MTECFRCGATDDLERFGSAFICPDCIPDGSGGDETEVSENNRFDTSGEHENPIDVSDVTDAERAEMLREYLKRFADEFGQVPRLMPLDDEGKAPIIQGRAKLDSPEGREFLVDGEEAIRQIREEGARGFAIYAGKWDHGTEDVVFVDHDDDAFPTPTAEPTLEVLSGSGRGNHETYRNAGDVRNARVGDNVGEIRAENWYVVAPGSVHPTGGIYHMVEDRDIATLSDDDLDDSMRPASSRRDRDESEPTAVDLDDDDAGTPEDETIDERLQRAFANSHDGDRIEDVYHGRYRAAGFDDRSAAEFWLANRLDSWVARGDRRVVERLMESANLQKWPERPDRSYRDSVLSEVGYQDWYYDPNNPGEREDQSRPELLDAALDRGEDVDAKPTSTLPLAQLDALEPHERRRAARKRGLSWPTTDEARDRLSENIHEILRHEDTRVVDAPTSLGKTYTVATTRWGAREDITGGRPVVHLLETRDARDEAIQAAHEDGGEFMVLRSRHEACPVCAGHHDPREVRECGDEERQVITVDGEPASQVLDRLCDHKGVPFSVAHGYVADNNDQGVTLPCEDGTTCEAIAQWGRFRAGPSGDPEDDTYWPLVLATHNFAFAPGLRMGNNIVIDELPDYRQELSTERVRKAVTAFLQETDATVTTWEALISLSQYDGYGGDAAAEREALKRDLDAEPDREWYLEEPDAHVLAPALARAIFHADDAGNGRRRGKTRYEPPRLEANSRDDDMWNDEWVTVIIDDSNEICLVRAVPGFNSARSVCGLDAHPAMPVWQTNTLPKMRDRAVLDTEERRLWRRYERGLRVVQVGDATRPLSGSNAEEWFDEDRLRTLLSHLRDEYGTDFRTALTTAQVEDNLEDLMHDVGIHNPELMHFGEEKSRNDFANEPVGLVNGCMDPGDDYVLDLLAELNLDAEPKRDTRDDGEEYRAPGREFVGDDADSAGEILASVRENHIAQAGGRYGRNPDDPESTATVFIRTDATPPGFADVEVPGVSWTFTETQREIVDELRSATASRTAREIADAVGCSKEHVRQTLTSLEDDDVVQAIADAGSYGATLYADDGLPNSGVVDVETTNDHVLESTSMWSLAIRDPDRADQADTHGGEATSTSEWDWQTAANTGDPPD